MKFFETMAEFLQDGQQLSMVIRKSGNMLAVSVLPDSSGVKDKALSNLKPLVMSGTPEDFEEGFVTGLAPLAEAQGLVENIKEFEEGTEKARKESEMVKKQKDEAAKKKKEFDDLIAQARKLNDEHKFRDARGVLSKAAALQVADKALVERVKSEISIRSGEGSLFGGFPDKSEKVSSEETAVEQEPLDEGGNEEETDDPADDILAEYEASIENSNI